MNSTALPAEAILQERYFNLLDRRDLPGIEELFCASATAVYDFNGPDPLIGRDAIMEALTIVETFAGTLHTRSSTGLNPDGVTWTTFALAVVHLADGTVLQRGLRYDDRWTREDGALRIVQREQRCLWELGDGSLTPRAQRVAKHRLHHGNPE
ncbi:nuclear transport factor 2 family protein [Aeromicrobium sp.]|uniref:nuclear transport factor 2 family protein n=1 Tax=Aeromicrobium sp. TaxID=1871063 RepID=UPI0028B02F66|nr:nuclear transport factor 2 family protein [Aeromicrobium sp.]